MSLVLPGFANVHSHAFQRLMRGAVQRRDPAKEDDFWTWRERMYATASRLDLATLENAARLTYAECLESGYTAVGEFHYLHHDRDGAPWPDPLAAARVHIRAAQAVGIRLTLFYTAYACAGIAGEPLTLAQRRFATPTLAAIEKALDDLQHAADTRRVSVGLAIHSVRAVPRPWLAPLARMARARGLPIHIHVAEQRGEVQACRAHHGVSPIALLVGEGVAGADVTFVHATWLDDHDLALIAQTKTRVALCPTTEADLGDGIARVADLFRSHVPLCIGSDSHAVIDPFREVAMVEQLARLQTLSRCVLASPSGDVAPVLATIGTANGYASLGLTNCYEAGADRVTLRADARLLMASEDPIASALTAGHPGLVDTVEVDGRVVVSAGRALGGGP